MSYACDVTSIVVSYNCLEALKNCLQSLLKQQGIRLEIVVVDNGSADGSAEYLRSQPIESMFPGRNLGYGAAVNLGAQKAHGEYLFILNADVVLPSNSLQQLLDFARSNPRAGVASPALCNPDGSLQISARSFPRRRDFVWGRGSPLFTLGLATEKDAGYIIHQGQQPAEVPALSATAILVKTELFKEIGGFDERFFMYLEDIDLCRRVHQRGLEVWLVPAVKVIHCWRQSSRKRPLFTSYQHHLSVYKYFSKHYPSQWGRNLLLAIALGLSFSLVCLLAFLGRRN